MESESGHIVNTREKMGEYAEKHFSVQYLRLLIIHIIT